MKNDLIAIVSQESRGLFGPMEVWPSYDGNSFFHYSTHSTTILQIA